MPESENRRFINFYVEDPARKEATKQYAISKDCKPEDLTAFILTFAKEVMLMEREACALVSEELIYDSAEGPIRARSDLRIGFFEF